MVREHTVVCVVVSCGGEGGWAVGMEHEGKLRMRRSIQYVEEEGYLGSCKGESTSSRKSFWKEVYQKVRVVRVREEKWEVGVKKGEFW